MQNLVGMNNREWAVVDMDTGTVLGTNLVLVPVSDSESQWEDVLSSDSEAAEYGLEYGVPLYAAPDCGDPGPDCIEHNGECD